jgi:hypothetical protein
LRFAWRSDQHVVPRRSKRLTEGFANEGASCCGDSGCHEDGESRSPISAPMRWLF